MPWEFVGRRGDDMLEYRDETGKSHFMPSNVDPRAVEAMVRHARSTERRPVYGPPAPEATGPAPAPVEGPQEAPGVVPDGRGGVVQLARYMDASGQLHGSLAQDNTLEAKERQLLLQRAEIDRVLAEIQARKAKARPAK